MDNFYDSFDEAYDGQDPEREANQFEERLQANQNQYLDPSTIEEVFEYYRYTHAYQKALKLLEFAIDRFPYRADFYFKKSLIDFEMSNLGLAAYSIAKALEQQPFDPEFHLHRARIFLAQHNVEEAQHAMQLAVEYTADPAETDFQAGVIWQHADEHAKAIAAFQNALNHGLDVEDAVYEIIYCYEAMDRPDAAIQFCQSYLDDNPYSIVAWYNLGMLYQKAELYESSLQAFEYSILIDESFISASYAKGVSMMALGRYQQAVRVFLECLHMEAEDAAALLALAECYEELNDSKRARFYYQKVSKLYSAIPEGWLGIAATLETEERYLEAIHHYHKTLELSDDYFDAWLGLAECEYHLGNAISAFEALGKAIALDPHDLQLWHEWAERLAHDNNYEAACELLAQGFEANPKAIALAYQYAAYAFQAGRSNEAFVYLENALLLDFDQHRLLYTYNPRVARMRPIQELIAQYRPRESRRQLPTGKASS